MFTDENCNNDCEIIPEEIVCTDFQVTIEVTQSCRPEVFFTVN
jgi:hypothetical protein